MKEAESIDVISSGSSGDGDKPTYESPLFSVLTRMLIQSFCPFMKSEILFGQIERVRKPVQFPFWTEHAISGELQGRFGAGCDRHTLKTLATNLGFRLKNGEPDLAAALVAVRDLLSQGLERLCREQDFEFHLAGADGANSAVKTDFELAPSLESSILCPLESRLGTLKVFFALKPSSGELIQEWQGLSSTEPRKIRVYASQLQSVFSYLGEIEALERRWDEGPQIRAQMRARIKRLKRSVLYLKSESMETLFSPARKLAVEIAKQQGKQIQLTTQGTWLFLDKGLLNYLYEPILHLIRNAVDHGIEEPAERERVGKRATGHLKCIASFSERGLRLILSDDGRGFDFARIRARAVARGLITREEAEQKVDSELCPLVFEPGFSTRERADAISGRGLGLDIVKKGIESVGGTLRILSTSSHGTSFEITLPLSEDRASAVPAIQFAASGSDTPPQEQEERLMLLDELGGYFERLSRILPVLQRERLVSAAMEAYRLVHSIKGAVGFLGWSRVASFCHHYEELLKLAAEEKTALDERLSGLIVETAAKLRQFVDASRNQSAFPLLEIRRLEAKLLQASWVAGHNDTHTPFYLGKYHLSAVESLFNARDVGHSFRAKIESDFHQAIRQPYGALVQFSGARRGYAGILLPERTFLNAVHPFVTSSTREVPVKARLWELGEFAALMGTRLSEMAAKSGVSLQASSPLTYFGWGQPLGVLGNPTYCYSCEIEGNPFYLAGDFRGPSDTMEQMTVPESIAFHPSQIIDEAKRQCQKHFARWNLGISFQEISSQSDLVGFDGGVTVIISCVSPAEHGAQSILFISYESPLAMFIRQCFGGETPGDADNYDVYDCLNETSNIIGGLLVAELEKRKLKFKLSLPTLFVGKAYVANFKSLFVTNKWVGTTPHGKLELQILVTNAPG